MVLERLRDLGDAAPEVLEFNPWQVSGQEQITLTFFRELLAEINNGKQDHDPKRAQERASVLAKYSSYVALTSTALKTAGLFVPFVGLVATAGDAAVTALKQGADAATAQAAADTESLSDLKAKLHKLFAELRRPLLVVIDDIDRLASIEVPQIFQLVKANADFPQVIYLLLHDKVVVEKALDNVSNQRGKAFLEKIVQVSFDVPVIPQSKINNALFAGLEQCLGTVTLECRWSKERWSGIFIQHLQSYFLNLRTVRRFLASFGFQVTLLRGSDQETTLGEMEVNPIDLIALECVRLFEPSTVYERLKRLKEFLTRTEGNQFLAKDIPQDEINSFIDSVVEPVAAERQGALKALLETLFPPISAEYGSRHAVLSQEDGWFRDLRICHVELFDRYFELELAEDELSRADLDHLLSALKNREDGKVALLKLRDRNLLDKAVEQLTRFGSTLEPASAQAVILALSDVSNEFYRRSRIWVFNDPETNAWRVCYSLLERVPKQPDRFDILKEVIEQSHEIALPRRIIAVEESSQKEIARTISTLFDDAGLKELASLCAIRIRDLAMSDPLAFANQEDLMSLLQDWKNWGNDTDGVRRWVEQILASPAGVLAFISNVPLQGSDSAMVTWRVSLEYLEQYVALDVLEKKVQSLDLMEADETARLGIACLRNAVEEKQAGKPYDPYSRRGGILETWEEYERRSAQRRSRTRLESAS